MFSRLAQLAKGGFANPTYNILKRHMGRKSGTKFLEFPVRAPSKKQQKRRAKFMDRLSSQRDPQKEAIRMSKMERQYSNPKIEEELKAMMASMDHDILALSKPESPNEFESLNGYEEQPSSSLAYKVHGKVLLLHLSEYEKNQKAMVDTGIEENGSIKNDTTSLPDKSRGNAVTVVQGSSLTTSELEQEANAFLIVKMRKFFGTLHPLFPRKTIGTEYETLPKLFLALHRHKLHIDMESYVKMIQFFSYFGQYQNADTFFNEALELCPPEDVDTTLKLWSAKLENLCRSGQIKEALATLDRLQTTLNSTSTVLYNPLLRVLVDNRHKDESDNFWIRMHSDGVNLDVESFNIYLKGLAFRGEVERTFFVFREMVSLQLQPNTQSFTMLLHACGRAPWHVKGYEEIVFDALDLMEAAEYKPNKDIYTALINTFAQPGDAMAAEYYFWEMNRKGIQPDMNTYNALLEAYARAQSVGLKYGFKGRYTPPKPKPMSEEERAMIEIGAARYGKIMAAGFTAEPLQPGRGTKNELKKSILIDSFEDKDAREAAMAQIRREAQEIRVARRAALEKELEAKGWEFSVLNRYKGLEVRNEQVETQEEAALTDVSEDEVDDGKVRITWDDAEELEQALRRGSNELTNIEFKSDNSGDNDEGETISRRHKSKGEGAAIEQFNDDRIDDIDVNDFDDEDDEDADEDFDHSDDEEDDEEDDEDSEDGLTEEERRIKFLDEILDENTPIGQYKKREMFYRRIWDNMRDETFSDPFEGEEGLKGQLWAEEHRRQLNESNPEAQSNGEDTSKDIFLQVAQRVNVLGALDRPQDVKKDLELMRKEVDSEWDFLSFGRAPSQDYSIDILSKQKIIARRALKVFDVMIQQGIKPNLSHWNRLLAVYAEGVQKKDAIAVFNSMKEANMVDARTYEYMIRMFIRTGDMDKALAMKDDALTGNLKPTEESYGLILRLFTHRKMTAEALKILEEAHSKGITIHERNIKHLRKQCDALGVKHPNIPPDPHAWVKEVREERFKKRDTSRRRVQSILSKSFRG